MVSLFSGYYAGAAATSAYERQWISPLVFPLVLWLFSLIFFVCAPNYGPRSVSALVCWYRINRCNYHISNNLIRVFFSAFAPEHYFTQCLASRSIAWKNSGGKRICFRGKLIWTPFDPTVWGLNSGWMLDWGTSGPSGFIWETISGHGTRNRYQIKADVETI